MSVIRIVDVTDEATFALLPPCADPSFDHRTCDYWEDADRGSKAARPSWLEPAQAQSAGRPRTGNPFLDGADDAAVNPFAPASRGPAVNPFAPDDYTLADNPFAPSRAPRPRVAPGAPRKLGLLGRGDRKSVG